MTTCQSAVRMRIGLERNEAIAKRSDLPGVARAVQFKLQSLLWHQKNVGCILYQQEYYSNRLGKFLGNPHILN